ncbi:MAG: polyprenyl synthetase family protein [Deltaproteobacteria bacterium]|nr:polyprenyl synthetase family protein [Deltaproteobacteria bacterium]MBW2660917.1 polyprenyl synthetase family protein [Deltaproteobacteria bacterium]
MFNLNSYLVAKNKLINKTLDRILLNPPDVSRIVTAMKHSLMAGGKRIRPVLCLAATETVGGRETDALQAACAIEMIHTYSLIHDDLPAMDNDDLRRGKPTCHIAFDEATAILAGDALLTLAFETLSAIKFTNETNALRWLNIIHSISVAAGYQGMIEGQMRDIASEGSLLTLEELEEMHSLKTSALIEVSVLSGAILGGGTNNQIKQLEVYAKNIGLAFQVTDDILNIEGNPEIMGKAVGTDKNRKKSTYPSIMGLEKSRKFAANLINNALQSLESFDNNSDSLRAIANYIIERNR